MLLNMAMTNFFCNQRAPSTRTSNKEEESGKVFVIRKTTWVEMDIRNPSSLSVKDFEWFDFLRRSTWRCNSNCNLQNCDGKVRKEKKKKFSCILISNWHRRRMNYRHGMNGLQQIISVIRHHFHQHSIYLLRILWTCPAPSSVILWFISIILLPLSI